MTKNLKKRKEQQMIILVDQDGVLADYEKGLLDIFHAEHPEVSRVSADELMRFETHENYPSEWHDEMEDIPMREGFFEGLEPIEGAVDAVNELISLGVDVRICTAPKRDPRFCAPEKLEWIKRHFGLKMLERVILTRDKTLVKGDILIDDKPKVTGLCDPEWEHVYHDRPCNRAGSKRRLNWNNFREVLGV